MFDISIKVKNYKCFKDETGFDEIKRVNLIIGRNNSGKSSLLDVVESVANKKYDFDVSTWREQKQPEIIFKSLITESIVNQTFSKTTMGGNIGSNHNDYGRNYINHEIVWSKKAQNSILIDCNDSNITPHLNETAYANPLVKNMPIPIENKVFKRLLAERDIKPEQLDKTNIEINSNGSGITNTIQCFMNLSNLNTNLVKKKMLKALNQIFAHDAVFSEIICQMHNDNTWEIYLNEDNKGGGIALSKSGSGLKTVISVLAYLFLVPELEKKPLSNYVFGFEELENNIHPALLRRLNNYIYEFSCENNFIYFLTTHSNVLIDQFSKQNDAQIIHVTQSNSESVCKTIKTYVENNGVLDDLDVRASDLLQANGIIWVEGPSDRIYLNRWIELWSNGELKEGTHYQIIFYGGRLLSHLSADELNINDSILILKTNRNAMILIDSDKKSLTSRLNDTKKRIKDEFEKLGLICWITKGKEIENYIPSTVVDAVFNTNNSNLVGQFDSFFSHLDSLVAGEGSKHESKKPLLAEKLISHMTQENMNSILDLDERMIKICKIINSWNS